MPKKAKKSDIDRIVGGMIDKASGINTNEVIADAASKSYRFVASPMKFVPPYYNDTLTYRDMYYVPLYSQKKTDPVTIEKFFTDHNGGRLSPGDRVTVRVRATAHEDVVLTYFDDGRGSRKSTKQTDHIHKTIGPVLSGFDWKDLSDV